MEPQDEIAGAEFASRFPELYHYTELNGLKGIVTTNTLWATHFAYLNDRTEMQSLREPMILAIQSTVIRRLRERSVNRAAWRAFRARTNIQAEVDAFVKAVFQTSFEPGPTQPMAEAYLTSFCTHAPGSYEAHNGLLSQWRAYGGSLGRYCLVFDTEEMIKLLSGEWKTYHLFYLKLAEVVYHSPGVGIESVFPDLINVYVEYLVDAAIRGMKQLSEPMIVDFIAAATRFKHQGFREEQESRIISIPMPTHVAEIARSRKLPGSEKEDKRIRSRAAEFAKARYLTLFEEKGTRLPITRIIVGPAREADQSFAAARAAVGRKFRLKRSETPFIGRIPLQIVRAPTPQRSLSPAWIPGY